MQQNNTKYNDYSSVEHKWDMIYTKIIFFTQWKSMASKKKKWSKI